MRPRQRTKLQPHPIASGPPAQVLSLARLRVEIDNTLLEAGWVVESGEVRRLGANRFRVRPSPPRKGRDRGCWCLRIYGPGIPQCGRRELTDLRHVPENRGRAEAAARLRERRLNREGLPLLEVLDAWIEHRKAVKLSMKTRNHQAAARLWLSTSSFAAVADGELTPAKLLELREGMTTGRAGPEALKTSTARGYMGFFRQAWSWAHLHGRVSHAWPSGLPRWVAPPQEKTRKAAYTESELRDLMGWLRGHHDGRWLLLGWALVETGARVGEVSRLKVRDARRQEDGSAILALGGRSDCATKTRVERYASVSPSLASRLELERDPNSWLFPSPRWPEERHASPIAFSENVRKWAKLRGLFGLRDTHSLRRRGAAELTRGGVPAEIGARVLGQTAKVFHGYAEKAHYDLADERKLLWLDSPTLRVLGPSSPEDGGAALDVVDHGRAG